MEWIASWVHLVLLRRGYILAHRMPYFSVLGILKYDSLVGQLTSSSPNASKSNTSFWSKSYLLVNFPKLIFFRKHPEMLLNFKKIKKEVISNHSFLDATIKKRVYMLLSPSGDLGIGLVWHNPSPPPPHHISVRLLKSSSNWTKSSIMGPQLFLGWYQMILDFQTRFRLGSD